MMMRPRTSRRSAAAIVESAIVLPVALAVIYAVIAGALAIMVYQQVAALSREAARYASVHGYYHCQDTATSPTTATDVYNNAILPRLVDMDPNSLGYAVTWNPDQKQGSYVTVTVTYQMSLPLYGTINFSSTSTTVMSW